jgi:hypothetical protein
MSGRRPAIKADIWFCHGIGCGDVSGLYKVAAQPIDLVDNHSVDTAGVDISEQASNCRTLKVTVGKTAIIIHRR